MAGGGGGGGVCGRVYYTFKYHLFYYRSVVKKHAISFSFKLVYSELNDVNCGNTNEMSM